MMVVVPALAKREQCNPPTIARVITRFESCSAPQMSCRVNEPGSMQSQCQKQKEPPVDYKEEKTQEDQRRIKETIQSSVIPIRYQIWSVALDRILIMILSYAGQDPTHVSPPASVAWGVWIACPISVRVMYSMCDNPLNWAAFRCQSSASNQKIFDQFRDLVTAMSDQAMKAHTDAQATGNPVQNDRAYDGRPSGKEESCDCC